MECNVIFSMFYYLEIYGLMSEGNAQRKQSVPKINTLFSVDVLPATMYQIQYAFCDQSLIGEHNGTDIFFLCDFDVFEYMNGRMKQFGLGEWFYWRRYSCRKSDDGDSTDGIDGSLPGMHYPCFRYTFHATLPRL